MLTQSQIEEMRNLLETGLRELREEAGRLEEQRLRLSAPEVEYEECSRKDTGQLALEEQERLARDREKEMDDALLRIGASTYGTCLACGRDISMQRLRAVPWTLHCRDCAAAEEGGPGPAESVEEPLRPAPILPYRFQGMDDAALAAAAQDELHGDGRVETVELSLRVENGQVLLGGVLPSDRQHALLLSLLEDDLGLQVVVDEVRVDRTAFERRDRAPGRAERPPRPEEVMIEGEVEPEDPYRSVREGAETSPADRIVPEKEEK